MYTFVMLGKVSDGVGCASSQGACKVPGPWLDTQLSVASSK